jgi:hypothetical protein
MVLIDGYFLGEGSVTFESLNSVLLFLSRRRKREGGFGHSSERKHSGLGVS